MRFVSGMAGLLFTVVGLSVTGSILAEVLASPDDIDLPGGPLIPIVLALLAGAVPLTAGVWLLRKSIRGNSPAAPPTDPTQASGDPSHLSLARTLHPAAPAAPHDIPRGDAGEQGAQPTGAGASSAPRPVEGGTTSSRVRRPWLAMTGLAIALVALLTEMAAVGTAVDGGLETAAGGWAGL